jgi:hypothetical protein
VLKPSKECNVLRAAGMPWGRRGEDRGERGEEDRYQPSVLVNLDLDLDRDARYGKIPIANNLLQLPQNRPDAEAPGRGPGSDSQIP